MAEVKSKPKRKSRSAPIEIEVICNLTEEELEEISFKFWASPPGQSMWLESLEKADLEPEVKQGVRDAILSVPHLWEEYKEEQRLKGRRLL